jgi:hypothetical protein
MQPQKPATATGAPNKDLKPKNYVHDNIIRAASIKKENHFHQFNRNESYQLNPYNCSQV